MAAAVLWMVSTGDRLVFVSASTWFDARRRGALRLEVAPEFVEVVEVRA
jgi:hypothetical protein